MNRHTDYSVIKGRGAAKSLQHERHPAVFVPPSSWIDPEFSLLDRGFDYTVDTERSVIGKKILGRGSVRVEILPQHAGSQYSTFQYSGAGVESSPHNARSGFHTIRIGDVSVCEHVLACRVALGLCLDYRLNASHFPLFHDGIREVLSAVKLHLVPFRASPRITVRSPIAIQFRTGSYALIEPDEGQNSLVIDHEFDHGRRNALRRQRTVIDLTPERFAYIAAARTVAYKKVSSSILRAFHQLGIDGIPGINLTVHNTVVVDGDGVMNPRSKFQTPAGNMEPLMHEVIDKLAITGLLPGRFTGCLTTFRTTHAQDIIVARYPLRSPCMNPSIPHSIDEHILAITRSVIVDMRTQPQRIRAIVDSAQEAVFCDDCIPVTIVHPERLGSLTSFVLAPNHPTFKVIHALQDEGGYAIPYYVFCIRHCLQNLGFNPHFAVAESGTERDTILPALDIFPFSNTSQGKYAGLRALRQWVRQPSTEDDRKVFVMFPEGHYNGDDSFGTLHGGSVLLARDAGIPFVPARIDGFDGSSHPLSHARLTFGEPLFIHSSQRLTEDILSQIRTKYYAEELGLRLVEGRPLPLS